MTRLLKTTLLKLFLSAAPSEDSCASQISPLVLGCNTQSAESPGSSPQGALSRSKLRMNFAHFIYNIYLQCSSCFKSNRSSHSSRRLFKTSSVGTSRLASLVNSRSLSCLKLLPKKVSEALSPHQFAPAGFWSTVQAAHLLFRVLADRQTVSLCAKGLSLHLFLLS